MNDDLSLTEQRLRGMRWREPPPEMLQSSLAAALVARREASLPRQFRGLFGFIPRRLRWPLAACWLLALLFRLTTPEPIPPGSLADYAKLPPATPAQIVAHIENTQRLAHEFLKRRAGAIPPL